MNDVHFFPLIDADGDGSMRVPMFSAASEEVVKAHHRFYLMEIVPTYYRLMSTKRLSKSHKDTAIIRCPKCGHAMKVVAAPLDENKRGLYKCPQCKN